MAKNTNWGAILWLIGLTVAVVLPLIGMFVGGIVVPAIFTLVIGIIGAVSGWTLVKKGEETKALLVGVLMSVLVGLDMGIVFGTNFLAGADTISQVLNTIMKGLANLVIPATVVVFVRTLASVYKN